MLFRSDHFSGIATLHATLRLVLDMAGLRDRETGRHLERVSLYSRLIASQLEQTRDLPADFSDNLHRFAALHDVGKVGIPDRILLKPSPLTPDERQVMEQHVAIGVSLIDRVIAALNLEQGPASKIGRAHV